MGSSRGESYHTSKTVERGAVLATDLYARLTYDEYKALEEQLKSFEELETTHSSTPAEYYHKSIRLNIGDITLEIHGPLVKP
ncbi:hypothetical protein LCGC14_1328280 [marine sediment metagenome]|uniref:Uncharacterized protein n=1 Tax=marine sediment metagenome TaxID=412755 RepID=A0A0F9KHG3_9ZZZZ